MKKIFIFSLAAAGLLLAACNKETTKPFETESRVVTVSATAEDLTTKLSSSLKGKFTWTTGDVIGVWTGNEITPFTLDKSYNGLGYGKFTGTLPEGGAINQNSYAVYPYEGSSFDGTTLTLPALKAGWGCEYPTQSYNLYSEPATSSENGVIAGFKFNHATAYFRVTLKNIAVSAKAIYYECYCPNKTVDFPGYIWNGGKVGLDGTVTPEAADWAFIKLPDHDKVIESLTLILPVIPGDFGANAKFRLCACTNTGFGNEMEGCNNDGFLDLNLKAGDYYIFPDIVFPNEKSANDAGSGVNDGIEDAVVNEQPDNFWTVG